MKIFLPAQTVETSRYDVEVQIFGPLVYVVVKKSTKVQKGVIKEEKFHRTSTSGNTSQSEFCISKDAYDALIARYGENPEWACKGQRIDSRGLSKSLYFKQLLPVSQQRFDAYLRGRWNEFDQQSPNMLETLQAGYYHLFVVDNSPMDGYFYGHDGKKVMRGYHLDYIRSSLLSLRYDLKAVYKYLRSHPDVSDVKLVDIPYYNDDDGKRGIEFVYTPPDRATFDEISKVNEDNKINQILKLEQFRRPDPEDIDEYDD